MNVPSDPIRMLWSAAELIKGAATSVAQMPYVSSEESSGFVEAKSEVDLALVELNKAMRNLQEGGTGPLPPPPEMPPGGSV